MKTFKSVLFTLSVATIMGALTVAPAQRSQASDQISTKPQIKYRPDLTVTGVLPVYSGATPWHGAILVKDQLLVKVTNQGGGPAGTFDCFFEWADGYGDQQEYFWLLGGLAPGQSIWITVHSNGYNLWDVNHQYRFIVNTNPGIPETDYTNNTFDGP